MRVCSRRLSTKHTFQYLPTYLEIEMKRICPTLFKTETGNVRTNIILRSFRETIYAVEKQYLLHTPSVCL